jgi:hypothetical protein
MQGDAGDLLVVAPPANCRRSDAGVEKRGGRVRARDAAAFGRGREGAAGCRSTRSSPWFPWRRRRAERWPKMARTAAAGELGLASIGTIGSSSTGAVCYRRTRASRRSLWWLQLGAGRRRMTATTSWPGARVSSGLQRRRGEEGRW